MKRMLLVLLIGLGGCVAPVKPHFSFFPPPEFLEVCPDNYKEMISEWMKNNLCDADSVKQLKIGEPVQSAELGWAVLVEFNCANAQGGMTGLKYYSFAIH